MFFMPVPQYSEPHLPLLPSTFTTRLAPLFPHCSLEYIKEAVAEADPVTGFAGLIKQRRRWLNGTFFAMIYTLSNWARIWTESHHRCRPLGMLAPLSAAAATGRAWLLPRRPPCPTLPCFSPLATAPPSHPHPHPHWPAAPPCLRSFLRKCVLSLEFVYLMIMTFAGTWFGIGVFYTILYQLFMALFNGSVLLQNVRGQGAGGSREGRRQPGLRAGVVSRALKRSLALMLTCASGVCPEPPASADWQHLVDDLLVPHHCGGHCQPEEQARGSGEGAPSCPLLPPCL